MYMLGEHDDHYTMEINQILMYNSNYSSNFFLIYSPALYAIALEAGTDFL